MVSLVARRKDKIAHDAARAPCERPCAAGNRPGKRHVSHGLLQLALDGKYPPFPSYAEQSNLRVHGPFPLAASKGAAAVSQPAVRRFLQRMGTRRLRQLVERCLESFLGEISPRGQYLFLAGSAAALARLAVRVFRAQDAASDRDSSARRGRIFCGHLVFPSLCSDL